MKTENDLNAHISKALKKRAPSLFSFKAADKYTAGMPDFLVWHLGVSYALEVKYVKSLPAKPLALVLNHAFSPKQLAKMSQMQSAGVRCYGAVGVKDQGLYLIPLNKIPPSGNWRAKEWLPEATLHVDFKAVDSVFDILGGSYE